MLRLNASVHSWLTRQERRLQQELQQQQLQQQQQQQESEQLQEKLKQEQEQELEQELPEAAGTGTGVAVAITVTDSNGNQVMEASTGTTSWDVHSLLSAEQEFHKHLKDEVSDMYSAWDEADAR